MGSIPTAEAAAKLLSDVLGKDVHVQEGAKLVAAIPMPHYAGVYTADTEAPPEFVCACDLGFAARVGAALMLFPPGKADDSIEAGELDAELLDNLREVFNICAQLFHDSWSRRVRLSHVYAGAGEIPEEVSKTIAESTSRLDLKASVKGYGDGRVAFIRVPAH